MINQNETEWIVYYGEKDSKWEVFIDYKKAKKFAKKVNSDSIQGNYYVPDNPW